MTCRSTCVCVCVCVNSRHLLTFSSPTLQLLLTSGPGDSCSSAADNGWRISVMSFCPELARPLGVLTLIPAEGGRAWPLVRVGVCPVFATVKKSFQGQGGDIYSSLMDLFCWDDATASCSQMSADLFAQLRKLISKTPDVNMGKNDILKIVYWNDEQRGHKKWLQVYCICKRSTSLNQNINFDLKLELELFNHTMFKIKKNLYLISW